MRLPVVDIDRCPDRGLISLHDLEYQSLDLYAWFIIMISCEQIFTLTIILFRVYNKLTWSLKNTLVNCSIPTGLVLFWSLFTSSSVALVGLTMRGNVSVITKTLHVFTEAYFLVLLLLSVRLFSIAAIIVIFITFITIWVFSISTCVDSVTTAVSLGVILDFSNFTFYLVLACTQCSNWKLWSLLHGFAWHIAYLSLFVIIHTWDVAPWILALLRLMGAVFNIVAVELFLRLLKYIHIDSQLRSGWMTYDEFVKSPGAGTLWDSSGPVLTINSYISGHQAQGSAYTKSNLYKYWFDFKNLIVIENVNSTINTYICFFKRGSNEKKTLENSINVYVYDFNVPRYVRLIIFSGFALLLFYM
tara:strand:- start:336 stop:1412 length:1077 start_codon:yes stop_codon:yes gene_type:complete